MLGRMVQRVAHPDAFNNQFRRLANDLGVARLTAAEGARVDFSEPLAKHIGEDLGRIEQESLPTPSRIMGEALPLSLIALCWRCLIQQDAPDPTEGAMLKESATTFWNNGQWQVCVVDDAGNKVCALTFSADRS